MIQYLFHWKWFKGVTVTVLVAFVSLIPAQSGFAQVVAPMPAPGQMAHVTNGFSPARMVGMRMDFKDPFNFYFVMNKGEQALALDIKKTEYSKLIKYFLASLTTPNSDMWVNLSPVESNRIIPDNFAQTEMGRDLLAQDYLLKQLTSSLMYPEDQVGKEFWAKVYAKAYAQFGTIDIPVDTFNKVWIMADKANVYQKDDTVLLVDSHLKVMLQQDFMAIDQNKEQFGNVVDDQSGENDAGRKMASDIVRDVIVPIIEKEVNTGSNFAQVRQIYNSMILATWFKKTLKASLLGQVYADKSKVAGIEVNDPQAKEKIYQQYLEAYKVGVFNYIKDDVDPRTQESLPRKYFSGGAIAPVDVGVTDRSRAAQVAAKGKEELDAAAVSLDASQGEGKRRAGFLGALPLLGAAALGVAGAAVADVTQEDVSSGNRQATAGEVRKLVRNMRDQVGEARRKIAAGEQLASETDPIILGAALKAAKAKAEGARARTDRAVKSASPAGKAVAAARTAGTNAAAAAARADRLAAEAAANLEANQQARAAALAEERRVWAEGQVQSARRAQALLDRQIEARAIADRTIRARERARADQEIRNYYIAGYGALAALLAGLGLAWAYARYQASKRKSAEAALANAEEAVAAVTAEQQASADEQAAAESLVREGANRGSGQAAEDLNIQGMTAEDLRNLVQNTSATAGLSGLVFGLQRDTLPRLQEVFNNSNEALADLQAKLATVQEDAREKAIVQSDIAGEQGNADLMRETIDGVQAMVERLKGIAEGVLNGEEAGRINQLQQGLVDTQTKLLAIAQTLAAEEQKGDAGDTLGIMRQASALRYDMDDIRLAMAQVYENAAAREAAGQAEGNLKNLRFELGNKQVRLDTYKGDLERINQELKDKTAELKAREAQSLTAMTPAIRTQEIAWRSAARADIRAIGVRLADAQAKFDALEQEMETIKLQLSAGLTPQSIHELQMNLDTRTQELADAQRVLRTTYGEAEVEVRQRIDDLDVKVMELKRKLREVPQVLIERTQRFVEQTQRVNEAEQAFVTADAEMQQNIRRWDGAAPAGGYQTAYNQAKAQLDATKEALQAMQDQFREGLAARPDEVGGINLSDEHLTINIKVDGAGMPLPANMQDPAMVNIQGLSPIIREIGPITPQNVPVLSELMNAGANNA